MALEFAGPVARRNHKRFILCLLLLMVLVNLAVRYPVDRVTPMGSDTYFTLDLGRSVAEQGRARWILSPLSYFGLYPLSYPSGGPFEYAELHLLTGIDWNLISLVFSLVFTVIFVLGGFMLFRAFRLKDEYAVLLSGLMALSPLFLYFTYQQASGRGFLIPIFILGLFIVVWPLKRSWATPFIFMLLTFAAFSIHRSSLLIVLFEGMAGLMLALAPIVVSGPRKLRSTAYGACIAFGLSMIVWPYVPGLRDLFGSVSVISSSFGAAEWDFRTGFFFSGDSLAVLLGNLGTNYVGGIGLALLLLPLGFMAIYPVSRESRERDLFLIACLLGFAPFVWRAQYIQLIILPFAYLLAGLAMQRGNRVKEVLGAPRRILGRRPRRSKGKIRWTKVRALALGLFFVAAPVFSLLMFDHRLSIKEPGTDETSWPNDSEANLGIYIGAFDSPNKHFVSVSGLLERRIGWFSEWSSPIIDATALQASGYLAADKSTFVLDAEKRSYLDYLQSFYNVNEMFQVNSNQDATLYWLSWEDVYGFFRLYFMADGEALASPQVSTSQAKVTFVIETNDLGDNIANKYLGQGTIYSRFLTAVSHNTYIVYENEQYRSFLVAIQAGGS